MPSSVTHSHIKNIFAYLLSSNDKDTNNMTFNISLRRVEWEIQLVWHPQKSDTLSIFLKNSKNMLILKD